MMNTMQLVLLIVAIQDLTYRDIRGVEDMEYSKGKNDLTSSLWCHGYV